MMGWVVSKRAKRTLARLLCLATGLLVCYHLYVRNDDDHHHRHSEPGLEEGARGFGIVGSGSDTKADTWRGESSRVKVRSSVPPTSPWEGRRVAIVEFAPYHEEVWGAVIHSFRHSGANITLFRPPYRFSFGDIFDTHTMGDMLNPDTLNAHLLNGDFDLLVIASGDKYWVNEETRKAMVQAKGTAVVLIMHHTQVMGVERYTLPPIAREGRLSMLGLSAHTTGLATSTIANWSLEDNEIGWDKVLTETFVPVFPVAATRPQSASVHSLSVSRVAIQGRIEYKRRDYTRVFDELLRAIQADPAAWGYETNGDGRFVETRDGTDSFTPFTLHLLGEHVGNVTWPDQLQDVIEVHSGLNYSEYYDVLSSMDLLVPAFTGPEYLIERASSSMTAAIMAKVPVLVTPQHLRAYTFLDGPAVRLHPAGMHAIQAIRMLRSELDPWSDEFVPVKSGEHFQDHDGEDPVHRDDFDGWDEYHERLYERNDRVWRRIAQRLKWMTAR